MSGAALKRAAVASGWNAALSAALLALLGSPAPSAADSMTNVGLSPVRALWFPNPYIDGNPPGHADDFGFTLATGDFNGDGASDLATGIPYDDGPSDLPLVDAGAVVVRWGVPGGGLAVAAAYPTLLSLYASGGATQAHDHDFYGWSLATGDFNGDGYDDLAVGIPGIELISADHGAVQIHYGHWWGIESPGSELLVPGANGVPRPAGFTDGFGEALAVGDFNGDGYDDLAASDMRGGYLYGGWVDVLHGSAAGLAPVSGFLIWQGSEGIPDDGEYGDGFGAALAAGNFNGDQRCVNAICRPLDDLAIGVRSEDGVGAVMTLFGSEWSLIFYDSVYLGQWDLGGFGESGDWFGGALAAGDFDGDGRDDLAIGAPFEELDNPPGSWAAGEVTVLYGSTAGAPWWFNLARTERLTQDLLLDDWFENETQDGFGWSLAAGDFDADGRDDLAIGTPYEDFDGLESRGAAVVVMGGSDGLLDAFATYERRRRFFNGYMSVPPHAQGGERFGFAFGTGDFDADGHDDLAIGIPYWDVGSTPFAGAETILYGALFADGFESGAHNSWSRHFP